MCDNKSHIPFALMTGLGLYYELLFVMSLNY